MNREQFASGSNRKRRKMQNGLTEIAIALVFVGTLHLGDSLKDIGDAAAGALIPAAPSILVLTIWAWASVRRFRAFDEMERSQELTSFAVGFGAAVWVMAMFGVATSISGTPTPPLAMAAPLAAGIYALARIIALLHYR
ncbi:MAG: hypothetical protein KJN99_01605 [Marinicaulis sp.]|nr:hypothetical protein [Marinicaulis sp.]